jgi:hypothetical protein
MTSGDPGASTFAQEIALVDSFLADVATGLDDLLPTVRDATVDASSYTPGWSNDSNSNAQGGGNLSSFVGDDANLFSGMPQDEWNSNPFTGGRNVDPASGLQNVTWDTGVGVPIDPDQITFAAQLDSMLQYLPQQDLVPFLASEPVAPFIPDSGVYQPTPDELAAMGAYFSKLDELGRESLKSDGQQPSLPPEQNPALSSTGENIDPGSTQHDAGRVTSQELDNSTGHLTVIASQAGSNLDRAARYVFAPTNALGEPLDGPLNLYSKDIFDSNAARARAEAAPGYLIHDTKYYKPAAAAEAELRARLGIPEPLELPKGDYNKIWGATSRRAVRDAALGGSVATHNDLATLPSNSIQSKDELPTLKRYGGAMGGLGITAGVLLIYGGTQQRNPILSTLGITGGSLEVAGGGALLAGALRTSAPLQTVGRDLGTAGSVFTAPLTAYAFQDDLSRGQWFDAAGDFTATASSGLTIGGTLAGSAVLTEAGLVFGAFGTGVLVGSLFDKALEWATKSAFGIDLSPSALIGLTLTSWDRGLTSLWADPSKPEYTQTIGWKILQWIE